MGITKDTLKLNNGDVVYPKTTSDQVLDLENTVVNYLKNNNEIQTEIGTEATNTINNALEEGGSIKNAIDNAVSNIPAISLPHNLVYVSGLPNSTTLKNDAGVKLYDIETFVYNHIISMSIEGGSMPLIITFTLTLKKKSTPITEFADLRMALKLYYGGNGVTFEPVTDEGAAVNNNGVAICIKSGANNTLILTFITLNADTGLGASDFPITIDKVGSINDTVIKL